MPNYELGKVYRIVSDLDELTNGFYVGSTAQKYLSQRLKQHRSTTRRYIAGTRKNLPYVNRLMAEYGIDNFKIELLEMYPCSCKDELRMREAYFQRKLQAVSVGWNKVYAYTTEEERKERKKETMKEYCIQNKKKLDKYVKGYYIQNKKKLVKQNKEYRKNLGKVTCEICGSVVKKYGLNQHTRTKKHQLALKTAE